MSIKIATLAEDAAASGYVIPTPSALDSIARALHGAYDGPVTGTDEFDYLLRRVDAVAYDRCR